MIQFGTTCCSRLNLFIYSCLFFLNNTYMVNTQIISLPSRFVVSFSTFFCPLESCKLGVTVWLHININHLGLYYILYDIYILCIYICVYIYHNAFRGTPYRVAISSVIPRIITDESNNILISLLYSYVFPFYQKIISVMIL